MTAMPAMTPPSRITMSPSTVACAAIVAYVVTSRPGSPPKSSSRASPTDDANQAARNLRSCGRSSGIFTHQEYGCLRVTPTTFASPLCTRGLPQLERSKHYLKLAIGVETGRLAYVLLRIVGLRIVLAHVPAP